jgi:hypothetical protein
MARDEYFSFGDEDLGAAFEGVDLEADLHLGRGAATALADPPAGEFDESDEPATAAERVQRSRGDSERASSEKRGPSPRRTQLIALAVLVALTLVVVRVASAALDGGPAPSRQDVSVGSPAESSDAAGSGSVAASEQLRASRERAAERQQVRQRRAKTRRRARRTRERRAAQHERRAAKEQRDLEARESGSPQASTEYIPPPVEAAPEAAPKPEASPPPSGEGGLQDGASSPEFGL